MKGDFSRRTFDPRKHYSGVQMQQGRVQLDADWNEQGDILAHRIETEAQDVIGDCGTPLHEAGFHAVADWNDLTAEEKSERGNQPPPPLPPLQAGRSDFYISAGRSYADGILCENERIITYRNQPDLPDPELIAQNGLHLVYLDVWQRHVTTLDDPSIREVALGRPDTATRSRTIWQVKWWRDPNADASCLRSFDRFKATLPARDGKLSARAQPAGTNPDPCIIPPSAGYRGLENQLYRVEVHQPGAAYDVAGGANVFNVTALSPSAPNQVTVSAGTWTGGEVVELFRTVTGSDLMAGILAQVVAVSGTGNRTLTLNRDLPGEMISDDPKPKVRRVLATFKWSRDNGSVVTAVEKVQGDRITVHDLGPDSILGFAAGQWVEITDDGFELNAKPAQLAQVAAVNPGTRVITLKAVVTPLGTVNGVNPARHPKLRRWDGVGAIKRHPPSGEDWQNLEDGIQVQFSAGSYVTGDYWLIPARTATADADSGSIEWPLDGANPASLPPAGIEHHYCPLGLLERTGTALTTRSDCRDLFPPLTELATLVYVSGDGQEAMPGDPIPQLLQVGVFRGRWPVAKRRVRFTAQNNGRVALNFASLAAATSNTVEAETDAGGIASCAWRLDADANAPSTWTPTTEQVEARLLDANGTALDPVVRFNGNLSIAAQVAYDPGTCPNLTSAKTVQQALRTVTGLSRLYYVSGDGQDATLPDLALPLMLQVAVANDCGPVIGAKVRFVAEGAGRVAVNPAGLPASTATTFEDATKAPNGIAECAWKLDPNGNSAQRLTATLLDADGNPLHSPPFVLFTGNREIAANVAYTPPADCPELKDAPTVQAALDALCRKPAGGCAITVRPEENLNEIIKTLLAQGKTNLCFCLMPGDHRLPDGLAIAAGPTVHLEIAGCGLGTRLLLPKALSATGLGSVTLRDLTIIADPVPGPIVFDRCLEVTIAFCHLRGRVLAADTLCRLREAHRITLQNNVFEAFRTASAQTPFQLVNPAKLFAGSPDIAAGFSLPSRRDYLVAMDPIGKRLSTSAQERRNLLTQLQRAQNDVESASADEKESYGRFIDLLTVASVPAPERASYARQVVLGMADIWDKAVIAAPGTALVLEDGDAETRLEDNEVYGVVSIYGFPGADLLTQDDLKKLRVQTPVGVATRATFPSPGRTLHVRNNSLYRLMLGGDLVKRIKAFDPSAPGNLELRRVYRAGFLTDNLFAAAHNELVIRHVVLTANEFDFGAASGDAGAVIAASAIYMGNHAPNEIRLFSSAQTQQAAANLTINIVPV